MYLIHNEGKSSVSERFIKTLETKIHKYMTLVLKNVYIDKLNDIVVEYNSTYHRKIKILMLRIIHILILRNKLMIKILNLKLAIMEEFLNTKTFLLKDTHQTGLKKFLLLLKLKM